MNRTDRLYAIVEELRAYAPASRTAKELAEVYELSTRTIERDILALQEAGVPIRGVTGRRGGYAIDKAQTLPPMNFTPAEALAIALALQDDHGPFAVAGKAARNKVLAAMSGTDRQAVQILAERIRRIGQQRHGATRPQVPKAVQRAIAEQLVVAIDYLDRRSSLSRREVEPIGLVSLDQAWYLVGWCRLREDARSFRLDRIQGAELTGAGAPERDPNQFLDFLPSLLDESNVLR